MFKKQKKNSKSVQWAKSGGKCSKGQAVSLKSCIYIYSYLPLTDNAKQNSTHLKVSESGASN